jgi:hypothetical protein
MRKDLIIPIYDCRVTIVVAEEFEEAVEEAGYRYDVAGLHGACLHYPDNPSNFVLIFREGSTQPGVIAHEAFHLTCKVMRAVDIEYSPDNHEAFAYLHGFIVDGVTQAIAKS